MCHQGFTGGAKSSRPKESTLIPPTRRDTESGCPDALPQVGDDKFKEMNQALSVRSARDDSSEREWSLPS